MSNLPALPKDISGNGQELWDWASTFSSVVHRNDEMRQLRAKILKANLQCGSCDKWMKSSLCPRERNINGYSRGPSCADLKCDQFVMGDSTKTSLLQWAAELKALESK